MTDFLSKDISLDEGCILTTEYLDLWLDLEHCANPEGLPADFDGFKLYALSRAANERKRWAESLYDEIDCTYIYGEKRLLDVLAEVKAEVTRSFINEYAADYERQ